MHTAYSADTKVIDKRAGCYSLSLSFYLCVHATAICVSEWVFRLRSDRGGAPLRVRPVSVPLPPLYVVIVMLWTMDERRYMQYWASWSRLGDDVTKRKLSISFLLFPACLDHRGSSLQQISNSLKTFVRPTDDTPVPLGFSARNSFLFITLFLSYYFLRQL